MASELPQDILFFHILPSLPPKSHARFKCVSKDWYFFLNTPMITKSHHHKLLLISEYSYYFCTVDCETPEHGLTAPRPLPFQVFTNFSILTSFDGLVCVGSVKSIKKRYFSNLVLWNPLTGDHKTLSRPKSHKQGFDMLNTTKSVLYYVSSEDDYKLLRVITDYRNVYQYSLKSDSWRKIESTEGFHCLSYHWASEEIAVLDGKLYFQKQESSSIIRMDLETGNYMEIGGPPFLGGLSWSPWMCFTDDVRGRMHVWMQYYSGLRLEVELWRMNDGDGDDDWTKVASSWSTTAFVERWFVIPLHLMANGDWIMHYKGVLFKLGAHNSPHVQVHVHKSNIKNGGYFPAIRYSETLVSPNRHMIMNKK